MAFGRRLGQKIARFGRRAFTTRTSMRTVGKSGKVTYGTARRSLRRGIKIGHNVLAGLGGGAATYGAYRGLKRRSRSA